MDQRNRDAVIDRSHRGPVIERSYRGPVIERAHRGSVIERASEPGVPRGLKRLLTSGCYRHNAGNCDFQNYVVLRHSR